MLTELNPADVYGPEYYASHCSKGNINVPYERSAHWLNFFSIIADEIIRSRQPRRVFDVGCAMGFLVECFWDRGVYCEGIDVSEYAISQARPDIREYCKIASITDYSPARFDLITCIEVLEHIPADSAQHAIRNICESADEVLFSSDPSDFAEPTHCNVRPVIYWLELFREFDFWPDARFDASFIAPHAMLLKKGQPADGDYLRLFSEYVRYKMSWQQQSRGIQDVNRLAKELSDAQHDVSEAQQQLTTLRAANECASRRIETLLIQEEETNKRVTSLGRELTIANESRKQLIDNLESTSSELQRARTVFTTMRQELLAAKDVEVEQLRYELAAAQSERARLEQVLESVLNSRTWRLAERIRRSRAGNLARTLVRRIA